MSTRRYGRTAAELGGAGSTTGPPSRYFEAATRYLGAAAYVETEHAAPAPAAEDKTQVAAKPTVVVGVDASPASAVAVDHAVVEAELRGWGLRLVHVQRPARWDEGAALLEGLVDRVHGSSSRVPVVSRLYVGHPAAMLVREAAADDLIVVGSMHGRASDAVGRSVSGVVAASHQGPVLVVRMPGWPPGSRLSDRPLVVGVDRTPGSQAALSFAIEEARLRGCELIVLTASDELATPDVTSAGTAPLGHDDFDPLAGIPAAVLEGLSVHVRHSLRPAGAALLAASREAAAVVVGARGHSRFGGLPLGSISGMLVHRASCPVFIVR
jgi:nucleotide-binding universal stress UspA family protein